jgi:5'-3' exonuclease
MGIPSYFSYIVKNHSNIIKPVHDYPLKITHFYLDSNSIIYDVIKKHENPTNQYIIDQVIVQICDYIKCISPSKVVYIAFDGVAPVAKLEQQRQRRYKSWYQNEITESIDPNHKKGWNTIQITPGTQFMNELNIGIKNYFSNPNQFGLEEIIVTTSQEPGEGEHKIFDYIRNNKSQHIDCNTVIYGIDADLFMISLCNLKYCKEIYLYRETPEFINSIDNTLQPNKLYILSINELAKTIYYNLTNNNNITTPFYDKLNDYVFICLLLGNDFLPHFPSLNIKNNGISTLIDLYRTLFKSDTVGLTKNNSIIWKNFKKFIFKLSENEMVMLKSVYTLRDKLEKSKLQNCNFSSFIHKIAQRIFLLKYRFYISMEAFINLTNLNISSFDQAKELTLLLKKLLEKKEFTSV